MSLSLNLESIILLLFFIAPGFVFTRTYTAYRPRYYREAHAFEQFVLAIVGSTIIHAVLLSLIALAVLIIWFFTGVLLYTDPLALINSTQTPMIAFGAFIGFIYLAISLMMARRFATFLGRGSPTNRPRWWRLLAGDDPPEPFLLWHSILQIEPLRLDLIPPRVSVQMRNGEFFKGDLHQMRLVGDEENTVELALRNVYHSPAPNGGNKNSEPSDNNLKPLTNQVLLLKSNDILWLTRNDTPG